MSAVERGVPLQENTERILMVTEMVYLDYGGRYRNLYM